MSVNPRAAGLAAAAPGFLAQLALFWRLFPGCLASEPSRRCRFLGFGGRVEKPRSVFPFIVEVGEASCARFVAEGSSTAVNNQGRSKCKTDADPNQHERSAELVPGPGFPGDGCARKHRGAAASQKPGLGARRLEFAKRSRPLGTCKCGGFAFAARCSLSL